MNFNDAAVFSFSYDGYKASEQKVHHSNTSITYFGFINKAGAWYIMEQTVSGSDIAWRYAKGNSAYTTSFALRETLTYAYFDSIFN